MKLNDFHDDIVVLDVTYRGRAFTIEARPERATRELAEESARLEGEETGRGEWHALKECVAGWSLEDPFEESLVKRMSPGLKRAIMQAVNAEANFPTPAASAEDSSTTSAQAADSEDSPAGT